MPNTNGKTYANNRNTQINLRIWIRVTIAPRHVSQTYISCKLIFTHNCSWTDSVYQIKKQQQQMAGFPVIWFIGCIM